MTATKKHRVLVSGAGSIGSRHLKNLQSAGIDDLIVVDPDETRASVIAHGLKIPFMTDFETALTEKKPTIVFICTPPALHVPQALAAVKSGADVFCEKPLSHSVEGIDELISAAKTKKIVTMVGCNMRFHPGPATVKTLIESGVIGTPLHARIETRSYLPRWRPQQDYTKSYSADPAQGGICLDGIHEIDLALWYFGPAKMEAAKTISAVSIGLPNVDGLSEMLLMHDAGTMSSVHVNFIERDYRRNCIIVGTKGTLSWDFTEGATKIFGEDGKEIEKIMQPTDWQMNDMYVAELQHFLECVEKRLPSCLPVENAIESLKIALAARKA